MESLKLIKTSLSNLLLSLTWLVATAANGQLIEDNIVLNTTSANPASAFYTYSSSRLAQRFTTDNSADTTLRRVEFDILSFKNYFAGELRIDICSDTNGYPSWYRTGGVVGNLYELGNPSITSRLPGHYKFYGGVELQPNTTYWAVISGNWQGGGFEFGLSEPGTGSGSWFGPNDDKSAEYSADSQFNNDWLFN